MKLKAKVAGLKHFMLMSEQEHPEGEKDAKGKVKLVKFIKEVSNGQEIEVPDKLGHKLMSQYPDNLEVIAYGSEKAMESAPQNKAITQEKTK